MASYGQGPVWGGSGRHTGAPPSTAGESASSFRLTAFWPGMPSSLPSACPPGHGGSGTPPQAPSLSSHPSSSSSSSSQGTALLSQGSVGGSLTHPSGPFASHGGPQPSSHGTHPPSASKSHGGPHGSSGPSQGSMSGVCVHSSGGSMAKSSGGHGGGGVGHSGASRAVAPPVGSHSSGSGGHTGSPGSPCGSGTGGVHVSAATGCKPAKAPASSRAVNNPFLPLLSRSLSMRSPSPSTEDAPHTHPPRR